MWARTLRAARVRTWNYRPPAVLRRSYNGQQGPHTTYFQQEPLAPKPSRTRRTIFLLIYGATSFTLGAGALMLLAGRVDIDMLDENELMQEALNDGTQAAAAKTVVPMTVEAATVMIHSRSGYAVTPKAVAHTSQLPSNLPMEDTWSSGAFTLFQDKAKDWYEWAVYDGHAGPRTAQILKEQLASAVGAALWEAKCMDRPLGDSHTINIIKKAFQEADDLLVGRAAKMIQEGGPLADVLATGAMAFSGSCALLALYDPSKSILRVANVGDSRAVLGRWDGKKYVAVPMSVDQTGFNPEEVARLKRDHPGEDDVVDPKTGRVHGIAVSRAFGDSRWKWSEELSKLAARNFWGPSPRPNGMIKSPPYLTAEPKIMETKVHTGAHPDFLIMASDGLWDNISNEDAITCVEMWLEKNKPTDFLEEAKQKSSPLSAYLSLPPTFSTASQVAGDEDTYFDEDERCMKWRVSPKHFVVEDEHCGVHLIKNVLGGKRRNLFTGLLTLQPPLSRNVRDDITVQVVFFGVDVKDEYL